MTENGRVVDPYSVDWARYDARSLPFRFRQPPGAGNALGRIKFMFPNKHDVYLHDTPTKNLFANASRAYSHGCVRVNEPIEFAAALLEKDTNVSAGQISQRLKTGQPGELHLSRNIPVHLVYFTAWANSDGTLGRAADVYGHDAATRAAFDGDYSAYQRAVAAYHAQKVAKFDPQAAAEAESERERTYVRRPRGFLGLLFGGGNR